MTEDANPVKLQGALKEHALELFKKLSSLSRIAEPLMEAAVSAIYNQSMEVEKFQRETWDLIYAELGMDRNTKHNMEVVGDEIYITEAK